MSPANLGRTVQQAPYHGVRRVGDEGDPADAYVESKAGMAGQPELICQLAEAGRSWVALSLI